MSKTLMFAAVLLLSVAWLQAQQTPSSGSSPSAGSQTSSQSGDSSGAKTVEGCLQGSSGSFTLTDSSGTTYQLQGDTSKLSEHVGHEVQIKGTTSGSAGGSSSSGSMAGSSAGSQQTLNVDSVKHVSKTCKSAGK
jgi:uncharacterized protein DUF5818